MPFPFLALAATAVQADQQSRQSGGAGIFELGSLFHGPQAGDQYGAFKPGGAFAPPSLDQFTAAAKGRDVGKTIGATIFPGIGQAIASLISGPGRGQTRRAGARAAVTSSPELVNLQRKILSGTSSFSAADAQAIAPIIAEARSLGGLGSKFGERANYLQDVVKFVFTGETSKPKLPFPNLEQLERIFGRVNVTPMADVPRTLPTGFSAPSSSSAPIFRRSSYWASVGTIYTGR